MKIFTLNDLKILLAFMLFSFVLSLDLPVIDKTRFTHGLQQTAAENAAYFHLAKLCKVYSRLGNVYGVLKIFHPSCES